MRKNSLKTIFIVFGILTVFFSFLVLLATFYKNFPIGICCDETEELFPEEEEVYEPTIITDEEAEPQST